MRHAVVVLALGFAFVSGACSDRGNTGTNDDAAAQDVSVQFDVNQQDVTVPNDVGPQRDAPPANYDSGQSLVGCGTGFCNLANGEECCVTGTSLECQPAAACANGLACDGPEDCFETSKPVCCGRLSTSGGGTACDTAASCTGNAYRLCKSDADCDSGQKCCGALSFGLLSIQYCLAEADCNPTPADPGVPCGTAGTCYAPDACCLGATSGCMPMANCTQGVAMMCDGPEDCQQDGGTPQVCCANVSLTGGASVCVTTCTQTGLLYGILCHSNADCVSPATCKTLSMYGYTLRRCQ
ncbi:MAG: hypothetical protein HY906_09180 [Deltaproteobacteria bacterium]|nr:hypothetical protein [Deltaproteobacteria bacterium]